MTRSAIDALYVTGGGSELPMVARMLKEVFGRRVRRSAYTRSRDGDRSGNPGGRLGGLRAARKLHAALRRVAGIQAGRTVIFDPLFPKGTPLPAPGDSAAHASRARYFAGA